MRKIKLSVSPLIFEDICHFGKIPIHKNKTPNSENDWGKENSIISSNSTPQVVKSAYHQFNKYSILSIPC